MRKPNVGVLFIMVAATLAILGGVLASYLGAFRGVEVKEADSAGFTLLSKSHTGAYHKIMAVITEVEEWAKANGVDCPKTFGEFLDDPNKTEEGRLRANAGCWVGEGQMAIKAKLPDGMEARFIPPQKMVEAEFAGSPAIGPWKVYPQAMGYMADHQLKPAGPSFEVYTVINEKEMTTRYLFPVQQ